ncbi:MAG: glutamyl-tRNA reductase [Actinomycetota bacterium]
MAILALGASFRRAPIELLERLAFTDDDYTKAFRRAEDDEAIRGLVVLSTCNRVELYADVPSFHAGFLTLKELLCESREIDPDELAEPLYSHFDEHAAEHLFAVAGGLDSMVLGEPQIHAQVREALRRAQAEGAADEELTALFHAGARAGRRVRTETGVGAAPDALIEAGAAIAGRELGDLAGARAVVIGAGQMSALAVKHLHARGVGPVRILNRSLERARLLAERTDAHADHLDALPQALAQADLVITATGAAGTVVGADTVRDALAVRDDPRPLVFLDLAVPRDVEPEVAAIDGAIVADVDALKVALHEHDAETAAEIERANAIVRDELHRFSVRRRSDRLAPLIRALRERGFMVMDGELQRFRSRLSSLTPDEIDAVEGIARGIVSKLLHDPIVQLKERSTPGTDDIYARMLAELFDIDPPDA